MAGTVTTHRALLSLVAILATHVDVQRALQREVDAVCGQRQPVVADKYNMHYTTAVRELYFSLAPSGWFFRNACRARGNHH